MSSPSIAASIRREDYDAIKAITQNDAYFLDTFDEWLKFEVEELAKLQARGITVEKIIVDPEKFAAYCRASRVQPNKITFLAFAVAEQHRK